MVVLSGIVFDFDDPDCEYEQLETNDRMCLDRIGSTTWQLTDISIGATCKLQGEHTLAFGFGLCLVQNVATDAEVDPALLLQVDLVRHKTSREVLFVKLPRRVNHCSTGSRRVGTTRHQLMSLAQLHFPCAL